MLFSCRADAGVIWDLNDVSLLLPLPQRGEESLMWAPQTAGGQGILLPARFLQALPRITSDLDPRTLYTQALKVVAIRLDPCFAEALSMRVCQPQVRVVLQPLVYERYTWVALDAALHVFYALNPTEWNQYLQALRPAGVGSPTAGLPLQVHPILAREGYRGAFWQAFSAATLPYLGESRIVRVTAMSVNPLGNIWFFAGANVWGGRMQPFLVPRLQDNVQGFLVDAGMMGNEELRAALQPSPVFDSPFKQVLFDSIAAKRDLSEAELQRAVREALHLQNPQRHHTGSADCVSCHVAPTVSIWAMKNFPRWNWNALFAADVYRGPGNLSAVASNQGQAKILRAFGYFETDPIVSPRTVNESAEVVRQLLGTGFQSLNDAMRLNPALAQTVMALKAAAKVECLGDQNPMMVQRRGPESRPAVTLQSACYDPTVFNPNQLGQLMVTYYGDGRLPTSPVGEVIEVKFEVFK